VHCQGLCCCCCCCCYGRTWIG